MARFGVTLAIVLSFIVPTCLSQISSPPQTTQGIPPFSLDSNAGGGIDTINLGNLGMLLTIPINSNGVYGPKSSATLKMESGFPLILSDSTLEIGYYGGFTLQSPAAGPAYYWTGPTGCTGGASGVIDATGAYHNTATISLNCSTLTVSAPGRDGWQIAGIGTSGGYPVFYAIAPDGTVTSENPWLLISQDTTQVYQTDLHGNTSTYTYYAAQGGQVYSDTLNNEVALTVASGAPPSLIEYPGPGGTTSEYTPNWSKGTVNSDGGCSAYYPPYQGQTTAYFLNTLTLPDTSKYVFTYENYWGTENVTTGRVSSVSLPTGGYAIYTYSGGTNNQGVWCEDGSTATISKLTPDGTWVFTHCVYGLATPPITCNLSAPSGWSSNYLATTTVQEPSGDYKVYTTVTYKPSVPEQEVILPVEEQSFGVTGPGCSTSSPCNLGSQVICYNNTTPCTNPPSVACCPITERDVYTYVPGVASPALTIYYADHNERPTETIVYGFGGTRGAKTWDSETVTAYGSWNGSSCASLTGSLPGSVAFQVMNRVCSKQLFVGGNSTTAVSTSYFTYSPTGDLITQQDTIGGNLVTTATNSYDIYGRLTASVGPNGETTSTIYNACKGQQPSSTTITTSSTSSTTSLTTNYTSYDCTGERLLVKQDANGSGHNWTTSYVGDPFWRPMSTTDALNNTTNYAYTPLTKKVSLTVASGSVEETITRVDSMGRQQLSEVMLNGTSNYSITETDYDVNGRVSRVTIPYTAAEGTLNSTVAAFTYTYDGLDRVLTEVGPQYSSSIPGTTKTYTYVANDTMATVSPAPSGENTKSTNTEVNGLGEVTSVCEITKATGSSSCGQANTAASGFLTTYTYYPGGKLQQITQNAKGTTTQLRSFTYDNSNTGRMLTATTPESGTTTTTYDSDPSYYCLPFIGFPIKNVDNTGGTTCFGYDLADRVTSVSYPTGLNSSSTPNKVFKYDSTTSSAFSCGTPNTAGAIAEAYTTSTTGGTQTTVEFSGGTLSGTNSGLVLTGSTVIQYNTASGTLGTASFSTGPLLSGTLQGVCSSTCVATLAGGGSVVITTNGTDGTKNGTDFSGSFVGTVTWTEVTNANGTHSYTLQGTVADSSGNTGNITAFVNTGKGWFNGTTTVSSGTVTFSPGTLLTDEGFCYDSDGRATNTFLWTSTGYNSYQDISEGYFPDGQVNELSVPSQPTINYTLDPDGRIQTATASAGLTPIVTGTTYWDNGLPNVVTLGTGDTSTYTPWTNLQPYTAVHTIGTGTSNTITHTLNWNSDGTLQSLVTSDQPHPTNSQTCTFSYDDLERVSTDNCGTNWNESYSYDVFGNVTKSGSAPWPTSGSYNQSNNQYSSSVYTYDGNGRLTNDTFDTLGWDVNGNLINQSGTNLVYDAFDRPVIAGSTQYLYSPDGSLVATENSSGAIVKMFVQLPMSRAVYVSGTLDHYDRYDWQGSARVASTASRTVYSDTSYDAFGIPYWSTGTLNSQYASLNSDISSGSEEVSTTRRYHPTQGRWISPDSMIPNVYNPQSFNAYHYALNQPTDVTDPGGQQDDWTFLGPSSDSDVWWGYGYEAFSSVMFQPWSGGQPFDISSAYFAGNPIGTWGLLTTNQFGGLTYTPWGLLDADEGVQPVLDYPGDPQPTVSPVGGGVGTDYAGLGGNQIPGMPCPVCHPSNRNAATDIYSWAAGLAATTIATEGVASGFRVLGGVQVTGFTTVGPVTAGGGGEASEALLNLMRAHGRTIVIATEGSAELRYLESNGLEGSAGGENNSHIILRPGASRATAMEEFLHGTQSRLGVVMQRGVGGYNPAEDALMDFMQRHAKLLGLQPR